MTAIVAGQGLGLINTSLGLLGEQGQLGVAGQGRSGEKVVVNAATGNLVIQQQDEWLVGVGSDAVGLRTYNSLGAREDDNGDNWRLGLSRKIVGAYTAASVTRIAEDGHIETYYKGTDGVFRTSEGGGSFDTLTWDSTSSVWRWTDGNSLSKETYAADGTLQTVTDLDGQGLTLSYTNGLITKIANTNGEFITVEYDTTSGHTSNILSLTTNNSTGAMLRHVNYKYDVFNRLIRVAVDLTPGDRSISDRNVYITEYSYVDNSSARIKTLKQGTLDSLDTLQVNSTLTFDYEPSGSYRITKVTESVGGSDRVTQFTYTTGQTTITDPLNQTTVLTYDTSTNSSTNAKSGQLLSIQAPTVGSTTSTTTFGYDAKGNVTSVQDARGNTVTYRYDDNGNRIYERDAQGNVIERSYSKSNRLLAETVYTGLYVDGATPTLAQGGLTTRYVYDTKGHLRFVISPEGRVTERQYNALGQLTSTLQYSGGTFDASTLASWGQNFDVNTTDITLASGMSRVITSGSNGALQINSTHLSSGSDSYPKASTIAQPLGSSWKAEITVPSTFGAANNKLLHIGLESGSSGGADFRNLLLLVSGGNLYFKTQVGTNTPIVSAALCAATPGKTYVLEIETQPDGSSAIYVYESGKERSSGYALHMALDANSTTAKMVFIGYASTSVPDASILVDNVSAKVQPRESDLVSWLELTAPGTALKNKTIAQRVDYTYDFRGQLDKQTSYAKTDSATGAGVLDGTQSVTQYIYDQTGNLLQKIDARGIELATLDTAWAQQERARLGKSQLVSGLSASDIATLKARYTTTYTYDGLNRIVNQQEPQVDGTLSSITTVTQYDDLNLSTTVKKTALLGGNTVTLANGLTSVSTYDQAGRLLSVSNSNSSAALGTTSYTYDKLGRLVMVQEPSTPTNATGNKTYYLYDAQSRKVGELSAEGAFTEYRYNKDNQLVRTIRYAKRITDPAQITALEAGMVQATVTIDTLRPADDTLADRSSWNVYDAAGRVVVTLSSGDTMDGFGSEILRPTLYTYDGAGRLTSTTAYAMGLMSSSVSKVKNYADELSLGSDGNLYAGATKILLNKWPDQDRITRYYYSNDGKLTGQLDAQNYYSANTYDAAGRLSSTMRYAQAIDAASIPAGNTPPSPLPTTSLGLIGQDQKAKYFYDGKGQLVGMVDPGLYYTAYEYDGAGNRVKETRYYKAVSSSFNGTTAVTPNINDRVTTYAYDGDNRLIKTTTSPSGQEVVNTYDGMGNLVSVSKTIKAPNLADDVRTAQRRYDSLGRLTAELGGEGAKALAALPSNATDADKDKVWNTYATRYLYDEAGRRVAMIEPGGSNEAGNQTVYYYDKVGRLTHSINALGEIKQYGYNTFGEIVKDRSFTKRLDSNSVSGLTGGSDAALGTMVSALASSSDTSTSSTYNRAGQLWYRSTLNDSSFYFYDALSNLAEVDTTNSAGTRLTTYGYDKRGLRTSTQETDENWTQLRPASRVEYDAFGRAVANVDAEQIRTERYYDRLGRVIWSFAPGSDGQILKGYTYDAFDRVLTELHEDGQTTRYDYDDTKGQLKITTPELNISYSTSNSDGQVVSLQDANGNTTKYSYDKDGRLLSTTLYDKDGSTKVSDASTAYDKAGRVLETKDARGTVTRLTYDKANRVLSRTVDPDGTLKLTTNYRYDAKGNAVWTQDANGVWTQTSYDKKGRVTSITVDPAQIPSASNASDALGDQLTLVANPSANGALAITTNYTYDSDNQVLTVTQGANTSAQVATQYVYDKLGRRIKEIVDPATGGLALTTVYTYDDDNNVVAKQDARGQVTRYAYDNSNRLVYTVDATGAVKRNDYDIRGHLSRVTAYATKLDVTTLAAVLSSADIDALMQTRANAATDHVTTYVYDKDGRLTHTVDAQGGVTELQYDANGNVVTQTRYAKTVTMDAGVPSDTTLTFSKPTITATPAEDQVTRYVYDAANRRTWTLQTDYDKVALQNLVYASHNTYDSAGNVTELKQYAGLVQTRSATVTALGSYEVAITGTGLNKDDLYVVADSANDRTTSMAYDKANRLKFVIDGEHYVTQNDYDSLGKLKSSIRYAGAATLGSGFVAGTEVSVLDVGASTTGLTCWVFKAQTTDANQDKITNYDWDAAGRETTEKVTDRASQTLSSVKKVYDAAGHLTDVTDAYGTGQDVTTHYNYDTAGRLIEEIKADSAVNSTALKVTTRYVLDELGQRKGIIDPRGVEAAESNSDWAQTTRAALFAAGTISSSALPVKDSADYKAILKAYTTTQVFDAQGHVTQIVNPLGGTTNTDYDAFGNAVRVQDPNGNYGYFVFNQLNQSIWAIDPMGYATRTEYDALGQVSKITKYGNDVKNLSAIWSDTNKTTQAPTFYPDQAAYTAANGSTTPSFAYLIGSPDVMSGQTLVSAGTDAVTQIEHDLLGRQTKITDAENYTESMKYDALGNKTSYTNKLGGEFKYAYDRLGNLKQETLPVKVYQYNDAGAILSSSQDSEGKPNTTVINQYSYDARGNRTKAVEAVGLQEQRTTTYSYDALNRQVSKAGEKQNIFTTSRSGLLSDGGVNIVGDVVTKLGVTDNPSALNAWGGAAFHSSEGYVGGAAVSFKPAQINAYLMVGLTTTPAKDTDFKSIDWALYCNGDGTLFIYKKGEQYGASIGTYQANPVSATNPNGPDALTVAYDGQYIHFLKNGVDLLPAIAAQITQPLYADSSFYSIGAKITDLQFGQTILVNGNATNQVTPTETTSYDARGNVIESRAADGGRTLYYYDALDRKTAQVTPTGTLSTYTYNRAGDLLSTTTYGDAVNPQDPLTPIDANNARTTFYGYDRVGRQLTTTIKNIETGEISASTGNYEVRVQDLVASKTYDANGNVTSETDARGNTTWHYYDVVGNQIAQVDAERYLTVWTHDAGGHIKTQKAYADAIPMGFELTATSKPNDWLALIDSNKLRETQYLYDRMGRLGTLTVLAVKANKLSSTDTIADADNADAVTKFGYDGAGNLIRKVEATTEVLDWSYDLQGREKESQGASFTDYNAQTVRQTTDTEYNALGLKVRSIEKGDGVLADRVSYTAYGINGMTASQIDAVGNITWLQHDAAGRITLKRISRQAAGGTTTTDITAYTYDLAGNQIKQVLYNVAGYNTPLPATPSAAQTVQTIATRLDAFGEITGKCTYGGSTAPAVAWQETTTYDNAGRAIISNAGTGVTAGYMFDANGNSTLKIESTGVDLSNLSIDAMLARTDVHLAASKYSRRSELIGVVQQSISNPSNSLESHAPLVCLSQTSATCVQVSTGTDTKPPSLPQTLAATLSLNSQNATPSIAYRYLKYLLPGKQAITQLFLDQITKDTTNLGAGDLKISWTAPGSWVPAGKTDLYFPDQAGLNVSTNATLNISWSENYGLTLHVSKITPLGEVTLGSFGIPPAPVNMTRGVAVSGVAALNSESILQPLNLQIKGINPDAASIFLLTKPKNDSLAKWATTSGSPVSRTDAATQNIPGWFTFQTSSLPSVVYDFCYFAFDKMGRQVGAQSGSLDLLNTPASVSTDSNWTSTPKIFLDEKNSINVLGLGEAARSASIQIRPRTSTAAWSTIASNQLTAGAFGVSNMAGAFNFNPKSAPFNLATGSGPYDYLITTYDQGGKPLTKAVGSFTVDDATSVNTGAPVLVANLPTTVHFQNLPTNGQYVKLLYRTSGAQSAPWLPGSIASVSPGSYDWDAMTAAPNATSSYPLDYELQVFDAAGRLVSNLSGSVTVGATQSASTPTSLLANANMVKFVPSTIAGAPTNGKTLTLYYRLAGSTLPFTQATSSSITSTIGVDGAAQFAFDTSSLLPKQGSVDYEYYYQLQDTLGAPISSSVLPTALTPARLHLVSASAASPAAAKLVVLGFANPAQVASTSQTFNAYGEVVSQTDANGNTSQFVYNAMGKLIEKHDAAVNVTAENGSHTTSPISPVTKFYYDLQGRLIATEDNLHHWTKQRWIAEGVDGQAHEYQSMYADGGKKTSAYDRFGDLRSTTNIVDSTTIASSGNGVKTSYEYDAEHRVTKVTHPQRLDWAGNPVKDANSYALGAAYDSYFYDALGHQIAHQTSPGVDSLGKAIIYTDKTFYDALGRVTSTVSAFPRTTSYSYVWDTGILSATGAQVGGWVKTTTNGITSADFDTAPALTPNTLIDKTDVFGHQMSHTDLGGHVFTYTYNGAGWLTDQTSVGTGAQYSGQNIHYDYYADGRVMDIIDKAQMTQTLYGYDANGNKTYEGYATQTNGFWNFYQQSTINYDALNRITSIIDPQNRVYYEYDGVGNRRRVTAYTGSGTTAANDYWYLYDSMNRFTLSMGTLVDTSNNDAVVPDTANLTGDSKTRIALGAQVTGNSAVALTYDKMGNRASATYGYDGHAEYYSYTADGFFQNMYNAAITNSDATNATHLTASRGIDLLGRVAVYDEYSTPGTLKGEQKYTYDKDGQVTDSTSDQRNTDGNGAKSFSTTHNVFMGNGTLRSSHTDTASTPAGGTTANSSTDTKYTYQWWDSAQQQNINQSQSGVGTGTSNFGYDVNGHINFVDDVIGDRHMRYVNNAQGLIMRRDEIGLANSVNKYENYFYVDGHRYGEAGNNPGTSQVDYAQALASTPPSDRKAAYKVTRPITSNFDQNYQPINASYPGFSSTRFVVPTDQTRLSDVARSVWGDATLWYLIAEANGLSADTDLKQGQSLVIPNKVTNVHNSSQTYKVYDPGEAMGDTSPTLPDPPPPPPADDGCGGVGVILMVVVAVAVTALTAGALGPVMMGVMGQALGAMVAMGVGAMAGSIASQGVGMMTGNVKEFSWSAVGRAGVTAAVTVGMGELANASGTYASAVQSVSNATTLSTTTLNAMATNLMAQQVNRALGLQQGKFSWTAVASAGVNSAMNQWLGSSQVGQNLAAFDSTGTAYGTTAGILNGWTDSMLHHQKPQWSNIAANAFGSALGDAVVGKIVEVEQARAKAKWDAEVAYYLEGTDDPALAPRGPAENQPMQPYSPSREVEDGLERSGGFMWDRIERTRAQQIQFMDPDAVRESQQQWLEATGAGDGGRISTRRSGSQLPEVENIYTPLEGFFEGRYRMAANGLTDPNSTLLDKAVYFGLGMAVSPLAMLESPVTGLYNSLNNGARMGQNIARANLTSDHDEAVMSALAAISDGASAFTGLGGPATLLPTRLPAGSPITRGGPIADQMLADNFSPSNLSSSEFNNVRVVNIGEASEPGTLSGRRTVISPNNDAATTRSLLRENESADILVQRGFNVEQNPMVAGKKNPDYRINGEVFDNIAPSTSRVENIWDRARLKVEGGQTQNVVINMADSKATTSSLIQRFDSHPIPNLQRVIVIDRAGRVQAILPRR